MWLALGTAFYTIGTSQLQVDMSCVQVSDQGYATVTWEPVSYTHLTLPTI